MPEVAPALVEIVFLALVFFTIALAFSAQKITQALLGPLISAIKAIPLIGGKLASPLEATAQAVASACGALISKCEKLVGSSFHVLARLTDWLWRETVSQAAVLLHLARLVGDHVYSITGLRSLVHRLERAYHGIEQGVKTLTKEYHGIDRRVRHLERELAAGIGHDLRITVAGLKHEWDTFRTKELPKIEADVGSVGADVHTAEEWVAKNYVSDAALATEATAAVVLTALGLNYLRCNSNPFKGNRNACGLWGDLADILGLVVALEGALNFETLVHTAQDVAEVTTVGIQDVFGLNG